MLKQSNSARGFTFLEAMVALLVLVVCLTSLSPILTRVTSERGSIIHAETALSLLNNQLTQWSAGSSNQPADITHNHVHFNLKWKQIDTQTIQLCVSWDNAMERNQAVCGKAKR